MLIVDSHTHASPYYFEPVELLLFQMNRNGVEHAVLMQHSGNVDQGYMLECAKRFPGRFVVIGRVETDRPDAAQALERWAAEGIVGLRLGPTTRSPGEDPLAIWRKVSEMELVVSCAGSEEQLASDEFRCLVEQLPDLRIIIEHAGRGSVDEAPPYTLFRKVLALADYPNIYMKVHGIGEFCRRPVSYSEPMQFDRIQPFIPMVYEAFGPCRMMWGSDYPPVSYREGYANALNFVMEQLSFCTQEEQEWIFGRTALSVFKLPEAAFLPGRRKPVTRNRGTHGAQTGIF